MEKLTFKDGVVDALAIFVGYFTTAIAFGLMTTTLSFSLLETWLMSFFVYAGSSQFLKGRIFSYKHSNICIFY